MLRITTYLYFLPPLQKLFRYFELHGVPPSSLNSKTYDTIKQRLQVEEASASITHGSEAVVHSNSLDDSDEDWTSNHIIPSSLRVIWTQRRWRLDRHYAKLMHACSTPNGFILVSYIQCIYVPAYWPSDFHLPVFNLFFVSHIKLINQRNIPGRSMVLLVSQTDFLLVYFYYYDS